MNREEKVNNILNEIKKLEKKKSKIWKEERYFKNLTNEIEEIIGELDRASRLDLIQELKIIALNEESLNKANEKWEIGVRNLMSVLITFVIFASNILNNIKININNINIIGSVVIFVALRFLIETLYSFCFKKYRKLNFYLTVINILEKND